MPHYKQGAKGSMQLQYDWEEIAGHANPETNSTLTLRASEDGQSLQLVDLTTTSVLTKHEPEEKIYEISVVKLVELIRNQGNRLR